MKLSYDNGDIGPSSCVLVNGALCISSIVDKPTNLNCVTFPYMTMPLDFLLFPLTDDTPALLNGLDPPDFVRQACHCLLSAWVHLSDRRIKSTSTRYTLTPTNVLVTRLEGLSIRCPADLSAARL